MPRFIKQFGHARIDTPRNNLKDWLTLAPTVVALAAVIAQMVTSYQSNQLQRQQAELQAAVKEYEMKSEMQIKEYELSFKPKQEAYSEFMRAMDALCANDDSYDKKLKQRTAETMMQAFYRIDPFLTVWLREELVYFTGHLDSYASGQAQVVRCRQTQMQLQKDLSSVLFPSERGTRWDWRPGQ
jgi:hypothetical protein